MNGECTFVSKGHRVCRDVESRHEIDEAGRAFCVPCWGSDDDELAYHAFTAAPRCSCIGNDFFDRAEHRSTCQMACMGTTLSASSCMRTAIGTMRYQAPQDPQPRFYRMCRSCVDDTEQLVRGSDIEVSVVLDAAVPV